MEVKLISVTQPVLDATSAVTAEDLIVHCARVSSPQNQEDLTTGDKLLRYCARKKHWSVFTMADMTVEVKTSRAISAQVLRHQSFNFQEFSQRYAKVMSFEQYEARRQDLKNRQNSVDDLPDDVQSWFYLAQLEIQDRASELYEIALDKGVAKESARFLLPMAASTTFYMKGNVRSWIHYLLVRLEKGTQTEHREIAEAIWPIFQKTFPITAQAIEGQVFEIMHPGLTLS